LGVEGNRLEPLAIVGVVLPDCVGVWRPVPLGVWRPVREDGGVAFGVEDPLGTPDELLGGVGVVDLPNAEVGVGVVDRPNGWRGDMYRGVVEPLALGVRGLVGVVMFDDELLRRFDRDRLPDEPGHKMKVQVLIVDNIINWNVII